MTSLYEKRLLEECLAEQINRSLEERIVEAFDRELLPPEQIREIVYWALGEFEPGTLEQEDVAFDIIYRAIELALERIKL